MKFANLVFSKSLSLKALAFKLKRSDLFFQNKESEKLIQLTFFRNKFFKIKSSTVNALLKRLNILWLKLVNFTCLLLSLIQAQI